MAALALKDAGNEAFRRGGYDEAIALYSEAIAEDPGNHLLYSNRSVAWGAKEEWGEAEKVSQSVSRTNERTNERSLCWC
jgi:stress-induced-phosphoprotein 1